MSLAPGISGLRERSAKRMVLDGGQAWLGLNLTAFRATGLVDSLTTEWTYDGRPIVPRQLGATRDNAVFNPNRETRMVPINGMLIPVKGFRRGSGFAPTLEVTLVEVADVETLELSLGSSDRTETASGYHEVRPTLDIRETDYVPNIGLLASTSEDGQEKPVLVIVENCLVIDNVPFEYESPGELGLQCIFAGHSLVGDPHKVPCVVFIPIPEDGLGS